MPENVGLIVKNLCDEKGITAAELERSLGLGNASVARWIKGSSPNGSALEKVANYFHVSVDYLLGRTTERDMLEAWNKKYDTEKLSKETKAVETIAAHLDDVDLTDEECQMLELYIKTLVKNKKSGK